jgi:hypothetical protein
LIGAFEIGKIEKFLQPLINNKWPPRVDQGGQHFVVLNVSVNNKPFFFSAVVTNKNSPKK